MLAKLFKAFVGDKSANDIKEVQPVVDRVKEAEKSLGNLSADDLRGRSADLRERIRKHVESELTQIDQLHAQAAELPLSQLDQKEALFEQIDALELQVNEGLEEVLEEDQALADEERVDGGDDAALGDIVSAEAAAVCVQGAYRGRRARECARELILTNMDLAATDYYAEEVRDRI